MTEHPDDGLTSLDGKLIKTSVGWFNDAKAVELSIETPGVPDEAESLQFGKLSPDQAITLATWLLQRVAEIRRDQ